MRVLNVTMEALRNDPYRVGVDGLKDGRFVPNVTFRATITFVAEGIGLYRLLFVMKLKNKFSMRHKDLVVTGPEIIIKSHRE